MHDSGHLITSGRGQWRWILHKVLVMSSVPDSKQKKSGLPRNVFSLCESLNSAHLRQSADQLSHSSMILVWPSGLLKTYSGTKLHMADINQLHKAHISLTGCKLQMSLSVPAPALV